MRVARQVVKGALLTQFMAKHGYRLEDIASILNRSKRTIEEWEGRTLPVSDYRLLLLSHEINQMGNESNKLTPADILLRLNNVLRKKF